MTHDDFHSLAAQGYNRIPVTLELFADMDTPLSVYLKLANQPYSYLLESVVGGERLAPRLRRLFRFRLYERLESQQPFCARSQRLNPAICTARGSMSMPWMLCSMIS